VKKFEVEALGQLCLDAEFVEEVSGGMNKEDPMVID